MTGIGGLARQNAGQNQKVLYCASGNATAAGAGDNAAVTGESIDHVPHTLEGGGRFDGAELVIVFEAALTAAEDLTFTLDLEEADDDGSNAPDSFANVATEFALDPVVIEGNAGGTLKSQVRVPIDVQGLKRWIRCNITPNLSAGATDTVRWAASIVLHEPANGVPIVQEVPALP